MELTALEIKKISKKFGIPEIGILNFLAEEDRKLHFLSQKEAYMKMPNKTAGDKELELLIRSCKNFCEYEEIYVIANQKLADVFFLDWLKSCKNYLEKREVYSCVDEKSDLKQKLAICWMGTAEALEDVREAMTHFDKNSEWYKIGLRKIMNIYKH